MAIKFVDISDVIVNYPDTKKLSIGYDEKLPENDRLSGDNYPENKYKPIGFYYDNNTKSTIFDKKYFLQELCVLLNNMTKINEYIEIILDNKFSGNKFIGIPLLCPKVDSNKYIKIGNNNIKSFIDYLLVALKEFSMKNDILISQNIDFTKIWSDRFRGLNKNIYKLCKGRFIIKFKIKLNGNNTAVYNKKVLCKDIHGNNGTLYNGEYKEQDSIFVPPNLKEYYFNDFIVDDHKNLMYGLTRNHSKSFYNNFHNNLYTILSGLAKSYNLKEYKKIIINFGIHSITNQILGILYSDKEHNIIFNDIFKDLGRQLYINRNRNGSKKVIIEKEIIEKEIIDIISIDKYGNYIKLEKQIIKLIIHNPYNFNSYLRASNYKGEVIFNTNMRIHKLSGKYSANYINNTISGKKYIRFRQQKNIYSYINSIYEKKSNYNSDIYNICDIILDYTSFIKKVDNFDSIKKINYPLYIGCFDKDSISFIEYLLIKFDYNSILMSISFYNYGINNIINTNVKKYEYKCCYLLRDYLLDRFSNKNELYNYSKMNRIVANFDELYINKKIITWNGYHGSFGNIVEAIKYTVTNGFVLLHTRYYKVSAHIMAYHDHTSDEWAMDIATNMSEHRDLLRNLENICPQLNTIVKIIKIMYPKYNGNGSINEINRLSNKLKLIYTPTNHELI